MNSSRSASSSQDGPFRPASSASVDALPAYLKKYCVEQPEGKYTARDHAAWRFIMRQSRDYFKDHAVPIYLDGLKRTGVTLDRIPTIREMDEKLKVLGWGAVPVCGFIPPAAFLDFQARKILPIAFDMRSVDHIHYTPAPDIVHEAAGHAPIIADRAYADYLTMYAAMAQKAIFSREDLDVYEAIRTLSDVKENPDSTAATIVAADQALAHATAAVTFASEAAKVARMNWWTVEYGLLGSLNAPKIYGAGLLSSVGESQTCLSGKVRKLPLTLACVDTAYDITEPQPQLFVAEDIKHLVDVLKDFESTLASHRGGAYALAQGLACKTVTTTVLDSGLQISGKLVEFTEDPRRPGETEGSTTFVRYEGPVQLACANQELTGQSVNDHAQGFSTPLGRFKGAVDKDPSRLTDAELKAIGLLLGQRARLEFANGFVVVGILTELVRKDGRLIVMKWRDCTVKRGNTTYFQPEWGDFDMGVGERVVSVFGGPADRETYGSHDVGSATTTPGRTSPFSPRELAAFELYADVRRIRAAPQHSALAASALADRIDREHPDEWLLRLEAIELLETAEGPASVAAEQHATRLAADADKLGADQAWLIRQGLSLAATPD